MERRRVTLFANSPLTVIGSDWSAAGVADVVERDSCIFGVHTCVAVRIWPFNVSKRRYLYTCHSHRQYSFGCADFAGDGGGAGRSDGGGDAVTSGKESLTAGVGRVSFPEFVPVRFQNQVVEMFRVMIVGQQPRHFPRVSGRIFA